MTNSCMRVTAWLIDLRMGKTLAGMVDDQMDRLEQLELVDQRYARKLLSHDAYAKALAGSTGSETEGQFLRVEFRMMTIEALRMIFDAAYDFLENGENDESTHESFWELVDTLQRRLTFSQLDPHYLQQITGGRTLDDGSEE